MGPSGVLAAKAINTVLELPSVMKWYEAVVDDEIVMKPLSYAPLDVLHFSIISKDLLTCEYTNDTREKIVGPKRTRIRAYESFLAWLSRRQRVDQVLLRNLLEGATAYYIFSAFTWHAARTGGGGGVPNGGRAVRAILRYLEEADFPHDPERKEYNLAKTIFGPDFLLYLEVLYHLNNVWARPETLGCLWLMFRRRH